MPDSDKHYHVYYAPERGRRYQFRTTKNARFNDRAEANRWKLRYRASDRAFVKACSADDPGCPFPHAEYRDKEPRPPIKPDLKRQRPPAQLAALRRTIKLLSPTQIQTVNEFLQRMGWDAA